MTAVELDRSRLAEDDDGSGRRGELEVAAEEVRMQVRLDDVGDPQAEVLGIGHVLGDVPTRIDDDGRAAGLVAHEVRGVGQALEVVLVDDHAGSPVICVLVRMSVH